MALNVFQNMYILLILVPCVYTKVECAESPIVELTNKVTRTDILREVELSFAIQSQNVLKYFWGAIKIKFTCLEVITVA